MQSSQDQVRVGATIRALRERSGVSRRDLARQIGISASHLANIERGLRACTRPNAHKVAEALNVDPIAIMAESGESDAAPDRLAGFAKPLR
ncbi:helix-turn-helix domain-containing protein [Nocardia colli]